MVLFPQLAMYKVVRGSKTVAGVGAGASTTVEIKMPGGYYIVGVPKVSTTVVDVVVEIVNGGMNSFVVKITNNSATAVDVTVDYEVMTIRGS